MILRSTQSPGSAYFASSWPSQLTCLDLLRQADGSYENQSPTDFGSMAAYDDTTFTVQYTARDNTKYIFNHLGLLVTIDAPANGVMQLAYDSEGELTSVSAADASTTTLTYAGFRLAAIQETGDRTFTPTYAGSLQTIHDVDGSVRNFTYDANNHLLIDTWGMLATGYSYAADTERLVTVNWGLESDYSVRGNDTLSVPARVDPQIPALVPDADDATGFVTDPLGRIQEFTLDEQGRIEGLLGPDQDHLSGGQFFSWVRDSATKLVTSFFGPFDTTRHFLYNNKGSIKVRSPPTRVVAKRALPTLRTRLCLVAPPARNRRSACCGMTRFKRSRSIPMNWVTSPRSSAMGSPAWPRR